jgi:hypothetical protein
MVVEVSDVVAVAVSVVDTGRVPVRNVSVHTVVIDSLINEEFHVQR